jgi:hypothetical protein
MSRSRRAGLMSVRYELYELYMGARRLVPYKEVNGNRVLFATLGGSRGN